MINRISLLLICSLLFACDDDNSEPGQSEDLDLIQEMLDFSEINYVFKAQVNWPIVRQNVTDELETNGFEAAIVRLYDEIGDQHGRYVAVDGSVIDNRTLLCQSANFEFSDLPESIGYVKVNGLIGPTDDEANAFAVDIQESIASQVDQGVTSWIVDLSENEGGNMWPMIAGLGPLLGNNELGYFIYPEGDDRVWGYQPQGSYLGSSTDLIIEIEQIADFVSDDQRIAVILSDANKSSGEATALSFIGRPNTRLFGQPTCGLSTVITQHILSNGAGFRIPNAIIADRNRSGDGGQIIPDEQFSESAALQARVVEWLGE